MKTSIYPSSWLLILGVLACAAPGVAGAQEDFEHSVDTVRQLLESQEQDPRPVLAASSTTGLTLESESFRRKASRPRVLVPAIAGGVLIAWGGFFWGLAWHEKSQLEKEDLTGRTLEEARAAALRGKRYQKWGAGLAGAGGVALGVATVLYVLQVPKAPVSVGLGATGTSAFLQGSWP
jgi:hypothetical protein